MKKLPTTVTIGIPTCYGGESLVETIRSIRSSVGGNYVRIIVAADRTPITPTIARALKTLRVELYWNQKEGSQSKKIKQLIDITKTDLYISTQDDVIFDKNTLTEIINAFDQDTHLTMSGIRILPLAPQTPVEAALGSMVRIVDRIAQSWHKTDNHLSASGRCLAFRTSFLQKFRIPEKLVNTDMYLYLENKRNGGKFHQLANAFVFIRCPQTVVDQIAPSSRYIFSKEEMSGFFSLNLDSVYKIPPLLIVTAFIREFLRHPIASIRYTLIKVYTIFKKQSKKIVANPVWNIDSSTKKIIT